MIFYVTNNIERIVGIDLGTYPGLHIISNSSPLADLWQKEYSGQITLNNEKYLNTLELLEKFSALILRLSESDTSPQIITFKNTIQIERYCQEQGWNMLNYPAELGSIIENKISQYQWIQKHQLVHVLPPTACTQLHEINYHDTVKQLGSPFIVQYNTGHTGTSTQSISHARELEIEIQKYPHREARVSKHIAGGMYTINACAINNVILCGRTSKQLTGLPECTDNPLATVGNDWTRVSEKIHTGTVGLAVKVGNYMKQDGWKGLFGIDVIVEEETGNIYLIEINARQAASASFENRLANMQGVTGPLDWQLKALMGDRCPLSVKEYEIKASQIFVRKNSDWIYDRYQKLNRVGEYTVSAHLVQEKPLFDLLSVSSNIFIIPQNKQARNNEFFRIQAPYSLLPKIFKE